MENEDMGYEGMEENTLYINADIDDFAEFLEGYLLNNFYTISLLDKYEISAGTNKIVTFVFEEYFMRVGNRLTLTVVIDNISDMLRIHYKAGGGQTGIVFDFDYGAAGDFEEELCSAVEEYVMNWQNIDD